METSLILLTKDFTITKLLQDLMDLSSRLAMLIPPDQCMDTPRTEKNERSPYELLVLSLQSLVFIKY